MKKVDYVNGELKIKFYSNNQEEFYKLLEGVKQLYGRTFDMEAKIWTAPPTKANIDALARMRFDFKESCFQLFEKKNNDIELIIQNNIIKIFTDISYLAEIENNFIVNDYKYTYIGGIFDASKIIKKKYFKIREDYRILPIGFYEDLIIFIKKLGLKINIKDERKKYNFTFTDDEIDCLDYLDLYDYQIEAIKKCIEKGNGIIKLPTGAGKTEIFIVLCKLMKLKTLILFSRIDLARQTLRRAEKAGLDVGIVQGNEIDENHDIVMSTIQSANKLKNKYDMIIIDEVHNSKASQYQEILKEESFVYRFGFSATPFADGEKNQVGNNDIKQYIGDIIYTLPANNLIDLGKIAKPSIKFVKINNNVDGSSWNEIEEIGIINNNERNGMIRELSKKEKTIILVKKIAHGLELEKTIDNAVFLYGCTNTDVKEDIINKFENGKDLVIIASTIFDEGINIKSIKNLILAGGGKSQRKAIQRLGRGLRITENKNEVNIWDFWDEGNVILEKHSKSRMKYYEKEGFEDIEIM